MDSSLARHVPLGMVAMARVHFLRGLSPPGDRGRVVVGFVEGREAARLRYITAILLHPHLQVGNTHRNMGIAHDNKVPHNCMVV